jgi:hypothetical protein
VEKETGVSEVFDNSNTRKQLGVKIAVAKAKGLGRSIYKVNEDYLQDPTRPADLDPQAMLQDINRGSMVFKNALQMQEFIRFLQDYILDNPE